MIGMFSDTESPVLHGTFEVRAEHVLASDPAEYGSALELMLADEGYTDVLVDELRVTMTDPDGLEWTAPVSPELQAWLITSRPGEITMTLVCREWLELRG